MDLKVLEVTSAAPVDMLELLLLATRCVRQGTVANAVRLPAHGRTLLNQAAQKGNTWEQPLQARRIDPQGTGQESSAVSYTLARPKRHHDDTEESGAREEDASGKARGAALHLEVEIVGPGEYGTAQLRCEDMWSRTGGSR